MIEVSPWSPAGPWGNWRWAGSAILLPSISRARGCWSEACRQCQHNYQVTDVTGIIGLKWSFEEDNVKQLNLLMSGTWQAVMVILRWTFGLLVFFFLSQVLCFNWVFPLVHEGLLWTLRKKCENLPRWTVKIIYAEGKEGEIQTRRALQVHVFGKKKEFSFVLGGKQVKNSISLTVCHRGRGKSSFPPCQ